MRASLGWWRRENSDGCHPPYQQWRVMGEGHNTANRVLRGGSWNNDARNVRCAHRNDNHPGNRNTTWAFVWPERNGGLDESPLTRPSSGLRHAAAAAVAAQQKGSERGPARK